MKISTAGVVVVVPSHFRFLSGLIDNLNNSRHPFDHVLIVASGFSRKRRVLQLASRAHAKKVSVYFSELGSAGRNRNFAWEIVSEDLVFFMDADDLYSPYRNEVILSVFEITKCDMFLHGFSEFKDTDSAPPRWNIPAYDFQRDLVFPDQLATQANRHRSAELLGKTSSTNLVFKKPEAEFAVHHAHVTVRRNLGSQIRFHENFGIRNEDGVFAQDVLESGGKVVLSPLLLSSYRFGARAKPQAPMRKSLSRFITPTTRTGLRVIRPQKNGLA